MRPLHYRRPSFIDFVGILEGLPLPARRRVIRDLYESVSQIRAELIFLDAQRARAEFASTPRTEAGAGASSG